MSSVKVIDRRESKCEAVWEAHIFRLKINDLILRDFCIKDLSKIVRKKYSFDRVNDNDIKTFRNFMEKDKLKIIRLSDEILLATRSAYNISPTSVSRCNFREREIFKAKRSANQLLGKINQIAEYYYIDLNKFKVFIEDLDKLLLVLDHYEKENLSLKQKCKSRGMI